LNTDLSPARKEVVFLDASRPFPIESGTFDFVYSEHTIEHLTQLQGRLMLSECFRVLRPGGAIRMATPDLRRIITLLEPAPSEFVRTYLEWSTQMFLPWAPGPSGVCVVNNFFRDWGHQFIYDEDTLRYQLGQAGFVEIHACEYSKSETPEFRRVESHAAATSNEAMMMFETMVLEARKPGAGPSGSRCAVTAHQHEGRPE
jgi:SAM-dependent methyltransferase